MKHNLIIDGSNIMYSGISKNTEDFLSNGLYVGGITSVLRSISKLRYRLDPDKIFIVFDKYKSKYRTELLPTYKSHRKLPSDIDYRSSFNSIAIDILESILPQLGVHVLDYPDVEADDIIANFVQQSGNHTTIASTDKDYIQLISKNCSLYRQVSDEFLSYENIDEYLGFNHEHFVFYKCMLGDKSDNIEGCSLVGEKRLKEVINATNLEELDVYLTYKKTKWAKNMLDFFSSGKYEFNKQLMDFTYSPKIDIKSIIKPVNFNIDYVKTNLTELQFDDIIYDLDWKWILDWSYDLRDKQQANSK